MDVIGTAEVETSGVLHFGASPFCNSSFSVRDTVALSMPSTRPTSRALLPSLCSSIIAASRFSFSCTERAGEISGVGILAESAGLPKAASGHPRGLGDFPDSGFSPSTASGRPRASRSDTVMWRNPLFYSTTSGRPRDLFRFSPIRDFPEPEGWTSGYSNFTDSAVLEYHKDGPRDYAGFGSVPFSSYRKDGPRGTGGFAPKGIFATHQDRPRGSLNVVSAFGDPSGCAKSRWGVSHHLKTDLGGVQMSYQHLATPPDGPRGSHFPDSGF